MRAPFIIASLLAASAAIAAPNSLAGYKWSKRVVVASAPRADDRQMPERQMRHQTPQYASAHRWTDGACRLSKGNDAFHRRRAFELDPSIDAGKVSARIDQGVLRLVLPKAESVKPRRIEVTE